MIIDYQHQHCAHCESGVTSSLISHHGLPITESLAFGIGGGLYFAHLKFLKIYDIPLATFRSFPGGIVKRTARRLGVELEFRTYRDRDRAMRELDQALEAGLPVALRTGIYWLPYVPEAVRFQFNGHNIIVYGKENGHYLVSDPVFDQVARCAEDDLVRARFSQGPLAPKGTMYYPVRVPKAPDFKKPVTQGIKDVRKVMIRPMPGFIGVKGLRNLARRMEGWPTQLGDELAWQYLAMLVRMQEEIGTGGAGFRFMFASFLQEAAEILDRDDLSELSGQMTRIGDQYRVFAVKCARIFKKKLTDPAKYREARQVLETCADGEERVYRALKKAGF